MMLSSARESSEARLTSELITRASHVDLSCEAHFMLTRISIAIGEVSWQAMKKNMKKKFCYSCLKPSKLRKETHRFCSLCGEETVFWSNFDRLLQRLEHNKLFFAELKAAPLGGVF